MKRCTKCILPETYANIEFNAEGVCNLCRQEHPYDGLSEEAWKKKDEELRQIFDKYKKLAKERGAKYDCIVPFSGGKDSSYTLYVVKKIYGMNPLVVTFSHLFFTDIGKKNQERVLKTLGVDHIIFSPDWQMVKKLCVKSLEKSGDFCWHCHSGIGAYPMQVAVKYDIPLVIWGDTIEEPNKEKTQGVYDEEQFKTMFLSGVNAEEFIGDGITKENLEPFTYPALEDLKRVGVCPIYLGAYVPWDIRKNVEIIKNELGWKGADVEGSFVDFDKVECKYIGVRDYLKFIKRGYGRTAQLTTFDVRAGQMTREEALELAEKYDGKRPDSLDEFLKDVGMTEEEFMQIAKEHVVKPASEA